MSEMPRAGGRQIRWACNLNMQCPTDVDTICTDMLDWFEQDYDARTVQVPSHIYSKLSGVQHGTRHTGGQDAHQIASFRDWLL